MSGSRKKGAGAGGGGARGGERASSTSSSEGRRATEMVLPGADARFSDLPRMSPADVLAAGIKAKESGNEQFKRGDFRAAVKTYKRAYLWVHGLANRGSGMAMYAASTRAKATRMEAEEEAGFRDLVVQLLSNICACYLKLEDGPKAIASAQRVLTLDPRNTKAMWRMGQALGITGDLDHADRILTKAASIHTTNDALGRAIREELRKIRQRIRDRRAPSVAGPPPAPTSAAAPASSSSSSSAAVAAASHIPPPAATAATATSSSSSSTAAGGGEGGGGGGGGGAADADDVTAE